MRLSGEFVVWLNHYRKNVRKHIDGITYELDLNELIDSFIYMGGFFEQELTRAIYALTKPGYTIFDIGANIGCHTLRFSKLVGETGRVFAFEPTGYAHKKIERNIQLNTNFSGNIILEKKGVSNVSKPSQIILFKSSWRRFGEQKEIEEESIDFVTVDDYVVQNNINQVHIIKIDVDGFEPQVIEGAMNTIRMHKPVLFLELNNTPKIDSILEFLINLNYLFVTEKDYKVVVSKEEIISIVNSVLVNSTGFKSANFILVNDRSDYNRLKECGGNIF